MIFYYGIRQKDFKRLGLSDDANAAVILSQIKEPPKKLLIVISQLEIGGAQKFLAYLLKYLDRKIFDPFVVFLEKKEGFLDQLPADIPYKCLHRRWAYLEFPIQVFKLASFLKKQKPDLIFSMLEYSNVISPLAVKISRLKIPVIIGERSLGRMQFKNSLSKDLRTWLRRKFYPLANRIIAVSRGVAEDLTNVFSISPEKIRVIPNGVDEVVIQKMMLEPLPVELSTGFLIVSAGRLEQVKGFRYLIEAVYKLLSENISCKLVVLGEGSLLEELKSQTESLRIEKNILFYGVDKNPYRWFKRADIFVLPSLYEAFPNVVLEAMTCGTPVIATSCPCGPKEIIADGVDGMLVPPADPAALADAMRRLLKDNELRRKIAESAREKLIRFRIQDVVAQYQDLLLKELSE